MEKLPTPSGLEPENKCLGSLFMKLEGILMPPVANPSGQTLALSAPQQLKLHLTLQFREQRELLVGGHIKFGLKGGRLRVRLKNAEVPLASNQLGRSYELVVPKKRQLADASPQTENKPLPFISCKVAVRGTPTRPIWVFAVDKDGSVLKGSLKNTALATLDITAKPCYIEAIFDVKPQDVYLSEAEGLWPKNLSKKKIVVIERAIVRRFLEQNLTPYLSRQIMRYD